MNWGIWRRIGSLYQTSMRKFHIYGILSFMLIEDVIVILYLIFLLSFDIWIVSRCQYWLLATMSLRLNLIFGPSIVVFYYIILPHIFMQGARPVLVVPIQQSRSTFGDFVVIFFIWSNLQHMEFPFPTYLSLSIYYRFWTEIVVHLRLFTLDRCS